MNRACNSAARSALVSVMSLFLMLGIIKSLESANFQVLDRHLELSSNSSTLDFISYLFMLSRILYPLTIGDT